MQLLASALTWSNVFVDEFFWRSALFEKNQWSGIMQGLRILLTFGGAVLLLMLWRWRQLGGKNLPKSWKALAVLLAVLSIGVYFDFGNENTRYKFFYHRHELYHYYLGSKYFREVGYKRLYECTLIAEKEGGRDVTRANRSYRDLRINLIRPVADSDFQKDPSLCKSHFTPERWEAFRDDVRWFYRSADQGYWSNMQRDHGYNPPPVWTMEGKLFSQLHPASSGFFGLLAAIDPLLHLGIFALLWWAFGWEATVIGAIWWGANAPANFYWTGGAFLRQDWLFALVASVCLAKRRYPFWAGAALAYAALLRIFPALLFAGPACVGGWSVWKQLRRRGPWTLKGLLPRSLWRFGLGAATAIALLVPASMAVCGADSYQKFAAHTLEVHRGTPLTNHMGFQAMLTHTWEGRAAWAKDDRYEDAFQPWKEGRIGRSEKWKPVTWGVRAVLLGLIAWALRRRAQLWLAIPMSLPMVMMGPDLTCYYYSVFLASVALYRARPQLMAPFLLVSGASQILLERFQQTDDRYVALSWLFFVYGLVQLGAFILDDQRRRSTRVATPGSLPAGPEAETPGASNQRRPTPPSDSQNPSSSTA